MISHVLQDPAIAAPVGTFLPFARSVFSVMPSLDASTSLRAASLLFMDAAVADGWALLEGVSEGIEVYQLDPLGDAIAQITQTLMGRQNVESIHILSHGAPGGLQLGGAWVTANDLQTRVAELAIWQQALAEEGDILLYGCHVAAGEVGQAFVHILSQLTGADVAASNDLTGANGNWVLEVETGAIETTGLVFLDYQHTLNDAPPSLTLPGDVINYTENAAAVALTSGAIVTDPDSLNFDAGNLRVSFTSGGLASDRLSVATTESVTLNGRRILVNSTEIGTYWGGIGRDDLVITLNASANPANVANLLDAIRYDNVSQNLSDGSRDITFVLSDGAGGTSTPVTKTVTVIGVNDVPLIGARTVLLDGTQSPTSQSWTAFNAASNSTVVAYNTVGAAGFPFDRAGISRTLSPGTLDADRGFVINFTAQVINEVLSGADRNGDGKPDRAGFSAIIVSNDASRAIELGFNRVNATTLSIFAQEDGTTQANPALEPDASPTDNTRTLFTQAESGTFVDNGSLVTYSLAVKDSTYTLLANGATILEGRLRDYRAASVFPAFLDVYEIPNLLFLGDNTSATNGAAAIANVTLQVSGLGVADQTIEEDGTTGTINFGIFDFETSANLLTVEADSNNPTLVPANGLTLTAMNGNRAIAVTPTPNANGNAIITLTVNDGTASNVDSFTLIVTPLDDSPTGLALSKQTIQTRWPGAMVGILTVQDPDLGDTFTFAVDDNRFEVIDNGASGYTLKLKPTESLLLANGEKLTLTITVTDRTLNTFTESFEITVTSPQDVTGDGKADLIWTNKANGLIAVWGFNNIHLNKQLTILPLQPLPVWKLQATGDFNGDGKADWFWRNTVTGENVVWLMDGLNRQSVVFLDSVINLNWAIAGVKDFTGDNQVDILWRNSATGENVVWEIDNLARKSVIFLPSVINLNWYVAGVGDFNQDGFTDILWYNPVTGEVVTWEMVSTTRDRVVSFLQIQDRRWRLAGASDINGDGLLDLVWRNQETRETIVRYADSSYSFPGIGYFDPVIDPNWELTV